jgi:hypothetical protein
MRRRTVPRATARSAIRLAKKRHQNVPLGYPADQEVVLRQGDHERHERGDLEELRRLVQRGLLQHVLVPVVEPDGLAEEQEERGQRENPRHDAAAAQRPQPNRQRDRQREDVRDGQSALVVGVAPERAVAELPLGDRLLASVLSAPRRPPRHKPEGRAPLWIAPDDLLTHA